MHTNVFTFDDQDEIHKMEYIKEDPQRAYCGLVQIYNFLSDSVKYNRVNDFGYLIARLFINKDNHFFIEGKDRLGYSFIDFAKNKIDEAAIEKIITESMLYCIEFELLTPPYESSSIITLQEKQFNYSNSGIHTGKRLGFEFNIRNEADTDIK
jgi:hypothetical protein